jgi:alkylhydroperoxidase family enzyme
MSDNRACWIRTIAPPNADQRLRAVYETISLRGGVSHILQAQSLDPDALALHYALYRRIMFGTSPLSRVEREMIAVVVSRANRCSY